MQCSAEDLDTSVAIFGPDLSPAAPPPSQGRHTLQLQEAAADGPVLLVLGVSGTVQGVKGVSCLLETPVVTVLCQPRPPSCLAGVGLTPSRGRHEAGQEVLLREQRVSVVVRQTERLRLVVTDELLQILPLIHIDFPLLERLEGGVVLEAVPGGAAGEAPGTGQSVLPEVVWQQELPHPALSPAVQALLRVLLAPNGAVLEDDGCAEVRDEERVTFQEARLGVRHEDLSRETRSLLQGSLALSRLTVVHCLLHQALRHGAGAQLLALKCAHVVHSAQHDGEQSQHFHHHSFLANQFGNDSRYGVVKVLHCGGDCETGPYKDTIMMYYVLPASQPSTKYAPVMK